MKEKKIKLISQIISNSSTSKNTKEAEPNVTLPPSPPPPTSSSSSTAAGSHSRRGMRPEKHTQYLHKNQTRANIATQRRPLRTPTSSPLTMSSGLNNFMSPRTRLVFTADSLRTKQKTNKQAK